MKCVIPHQCLKTVVRAVWSLSKIGEEIYVEAQANVLHLKTTNCAKTAYVSVVFHKEFFLSYEYPSVKDPDHSTRCKVAMRPFLNIFKSLPNLEKLVDHCSITLEGGSTELVVSFRYKLGFVKSHHLGYQDCEKLQAVFSKSGTHNQISGSTKVLQDVAGNFPASLDEVSVKATSSNLTFKSYCEDEQSLARVGLTEITLAAGEFESYTVEEDTAVVFSLKTMRALLSFAEMSAHDFDLRFEGRGKPAIFSLTSNCGYEVDLVMATLFEPEPFEPTTVSQVSVEVGGGRNKNAPNLKQEVNDGNSDGGEVAGGVAQSFSQRDSTDQLLGSENFDVMDFDNVTPLTLRNPSPETGNPSQLPLNGHTGEVANFSQVPEFLDNEDFRDADFGLARTHESDVSKRLPKSPSRITDELFGDMDQDGNSSDQQECGDYGDFIPGTPEAKKYSGILWTEDSQSEFEVESCEQQTVVLAPDSDPEEF